MKHFASATLLLLLSFAATKSYSQQAAKPQLFAAFPNTITCTETELAKVFTAPQGQQVSLAFGSGFTYAGSITKYGNGQTAGIRSAVFNNAIFALSKRTGNGNAIVYTGRIYNDDAADGFELKRDANGNYQLVKFTLADVRQDCGHQ